MADSMRCCSRTKIPDCSSPMSASSSSASPAAPRSAGPSRTMRARRRSCSNWAEIPASSSTATADLATLPNVASPAGFAYAGQSCISVQRILVEHSVYGKFTELLLAAVSKLKVGDPLDESSDLGPLIRESDAIRAAEWVQEAVRGGARLLCGGKRKGSLFEPTVLTGTKPEHESELPGNFCAGRDGRALQRFRLRAESRSTILPMACRPGSSRATPSSFSRPTTNSKSAA